MPLHDRYMLHVTEQAEELLWNMPMLAVGDAKKAFSDRGAQKQLKDILRTVQARTKYSKSLCVCNRSSLEDMLRMMQAQPRDGVTYPNVPTQITDVW